MVEAALTALAVTGFCVELPAMPPASTSPSVMTVVGSWLEDLLVDFARLVSPGRENDRVVRFPAMLNGGDTIKYAVLGFGGCSKTGSFFTSASSAEFCPCPVLSSLPSSSTGTSHWPLGGLPACGNDTDLLSDTDRLPPPALAVLCGEPTCPDRDWWW